MGQTEKLSDLEIFEKNIENLLIDETSKAVRLAELSRMSTEEKIKDYEENVLQYFSHGKFFNIHRAAFRFQEYLVQKEILYKRPKEKVGVAELLIARMRIYCQGLSTEEQLSNYIKAKTSDYLEKKILSTEEKLKKRKKWKRGGAMATVFGEIVLFLATKDIPLTPEKFVGFTGLAACILFPWFMTKQTYRDTELDLERIQYDQETFNEMIEYDQKKWNTAIKKTKPQLIEILKENGAYNI
ncbi:MAG: hypothetical protein ABH828_04600 [archaeon]